MPTPISAFSSKVVRSTLTILPVLIRANRPFSFARASVRGKLTSTSRPVRTGAVTGSTMKTPVLLILQLRPLTNLLASGIQTLTGQETVLRLSLRCSINACMVIVSLMSIPSTVGLIGNVKLDRLGESGKIMSFLRIVVENARGPLLLAFLSDGRGAKSAQDNLSWCLGRLG